jgi:hypothetical protein
MKKKLKKNETRKAVPVVQPPEILEAIGPTIMQDAYADDAQEMIPCVTFTEPSPLLGDLSLKRFSDNRDNNVKGLRMWAVEALEDGTVNIETDQVQTFASTVYNDSAVYGTNEYVEGFKNMDSRIAAVAINSARTTSALSIVSNVNTTVDLSLSQAVKVILDDISKGNAAIGEKAKELFYAERRSDYYPDGAIYSGDIMVGSRGGMRNLGDIVTRANCTNENVEGLIITVRNWINQRILDTYEMLMKAINTAIYTYNGYGIVEADNMYAATEEYASEVFSTYSYAFIPYAQTVAGDIIGLQLHSVPMAEINRRAMFNDYDF